MQVFWHSELTIFQQHEVRKLEGHPSTPVHMWIPLAVHQQLQESATGHYEDCDDPSSQANILNPGIEHVPRYHGTFALYAEEKFPILYRTQRLIIIHITACHWALQ
jgi:hypothetical protein